MSEFFQNRGTTIEQKKIKRQKLSTFQNRGTKIVQNKIGDQNYAFCITGRPKLHLSLLLKIFSLIIHK
jgi:hypothetical protein